MPYLGKVVPIANTSDIADSAVTSAKIADDAIITAKVLDRQVTGAKIAEATIGSFEIANGAIVDADVNASAAIDATKIANGSVTSTEFQYINTLSSNAQTQISNTVTVANAALPKAGGTMTGETVFADQLATRPELKDYSETKTALSAAASVTIDLTTGNVFTLTPDQNTTFVFSNPSPTGKSCAFTLVWTQDGSDRTIAWPASVDWAGGSAPDVTSGSGKVDIYAFLQWMQEQSGTAFSPALIWVKEK